MILTHKELKKIRYAYLHIALTTLHDNLEIPAKKNNSVTANSSGFFSYLTSYHQHLRSLIVK
nr:hypothetical protein C1N82_14560 [Bacillus cereus]